MSDKLKIIDPYNHYPHHETFQGPFTPLKLDFDDVLIVPQPSDVNSRADVDLERGFNFKSGGHWNGTPIIASNMQNIGTYKVAWILKEYKMLTALVKGERSYPDLYDWTFETYGIGDEPLTGYICLDVANGYTTEFIEWVAFVRKRHPTSIIMAGNVATGEGVDTELREGRFPALEIKLDGDIKKFTETLQANHYLCNNRGASCLIYLSRDILYFL